MLFFFLKKSNRERKSRSDFVKMVKGYRRLLFFSSFVVEILLSKKGRDKTDSELFMIVDNTI